MKKNAFTNFIDDYKKYTEEVKKSDHKIKMIIPNLLTASRLLAPFFILPATLLGNFPLALTFAAGFALTDTFDGFLARRLKATSEFGKNLDPICDKFFILGVIIPFLNTPTMITTLVLEVIISLINLKSAFKNNKPKSTYLGKAKTVLLFLFITLSYLLKALGINLDALIPLALATNVTQIITALDYMHIDNKKDIVKEVEKIVNNDKEDKQVNETKEKELTIEQELQEYRNLRETFIEEHSKEENKTIGQKRINEQ